MQVRAWYDGHAWDKRPETPTELMGALQGLTTNAVGVGSDDEALLIR